MEKMQVQKAVGSEEEDFFRELDARNSRFLKAPVVQAPAEPDLVVNYEVEAWQYAIELGRRPVLPPGSAERRLEEWLVSFVSQVASHVQRVGINVPNDRLYELAKSIVLPENRYGDVSPWRAIAFALAARGELSRESFIIMCKAYYGKEYVRNNAKVFMYIKSREFKALLEAQARAH
ncbi:MAG: hypothetical protein QXX12_00010 [Nanopusillaceae archaeon]